MSHFPLRDGTVHCEDVPLPRLAREVGTPLIVYALLREEHVPGWVGRELVG